MPGLISELTGGDMSDASRYGGWMLFAFSLMQFLFSPFLGNLSDQSGTGVAFTVVARRLTRPVSG
jgi:DHA1 family tetracycline resistance protein-like MFS transporter